MSLRLVRAEIKADKAAAVDRAAKELFTTIHAMHPLAVQYAICKLPDGISYVFLLGLENEAINPLSTVCAFTELQRNLMTWVSRLPTLEQLTPIGSYRLF